MSSTLDTTSRNRVVSVPHLLIVAIGGIGFAYLMTPSQDQLLSNMERDRLGAEVIPMLRENWCDKSRSFTAALTSMSRQRMDELARLAHLTPRERMRVMFDKRNAPKFDAFNESLSVASIRYVDVMAPKDAYNIINPVIEVLPQAHTRGLLSVLSNNALAVNQPALAASILLRTCDDPNASWEDVQKMMNACQWSGKTAEAVEKSGKWFAAHEQDMRESQRDVVREAISNLALGANMPAKAFEMALAELSALSRLTKDDSKLVERARQAAVFAGKTGEMLPWIERYIATLPMAKMTWQQLLKVPRPLKGEAVDYNYWVRQAAQFADWNALAESSYKHHQRLVAIGDFDLVDRVLELTAFLGYGQDSAAFLKALGPIPGHENLKIVLARLVAANGDPHEAQNLFEEWTQAHPHDQTARYELANLIRGIADNAAALKAFESFVHDFPENDVAVKRLAELRLRAGKPEAALEMMDTLKDDALDAITLEDYTTLAEAMERPKSLLRGLRLSLKGAGKDAPEVFERMYEVHRGNGDYEGAIGVLREGIAAAPDRPVLRVKLASLMLEMERPADAIAEALHPSLRTRVDALAIALAAIRIDESKASEVIQAFGPKIEQSQKLPTEVRINLAVACAKVGQHEREMALFSTVPDTRENLAALAEAKLALEDFEVAEKLAERNLAENTPPLSRDWLLLGDTLSKLGRSDEAQNAYTKALSDIRQKIRSRNPLSAQNRVP